MNDLKFCIITTSSGCSYINEWTEYYFGLGFHKIFLVDNNENNKYDINDDRVVIIPGENRQQHDDILHVISNYLKYDYNYDYLLIIDDDEFLNLGKYNNIEEVVKAYDYYDSLSFRWNIMNDNGYIYISDEPKGKSIREIYTTSSGYKYNIKTLTRLPDTIESFEIMINDYSGRYIQHDFNFLEYKHIEIPFDICNCTHYITMCMERFLLKKKSYRDYLNGLLGRSGYLNYFLCFNECTDEKLNAYVELCRKYDFPLTPKDKEILDEHNIKY